MTVGASNRVDDIIRSRGKSLVCVPAIRWTEVTIKNDGVLPGWILAWAGKAEAAGCGNCGEQAAVALVYLCHSMKASPLDFMARTTANHAFVVLGRVGDSDEANPETWGSAAVVCDPWDNAVYPAADIQTKMGRGKTVRPDSRFRLSNMSA